MDQAESTTPGASSRDVLIEETPLGLSAEQMVKSNPKAVEELQAKAAADALAADRKRRTDLDAAFADDLAYAAQAYAAGLSVNEAKAQRHDTIAAELVAVRKERDELKTRVEAGKPHDVITDGNPEANDGGENSLAEFEAMWSAPANAAIRESFGGNKKKFLTLAKHEPDTVRQLV